MDAYGELTTLFSYAVCARVTNNTNCLRTAANGLLRWATTYMPLCNPITESRLVWCVQAFDVVRPMLFGFIPLSDISKIDMFLRWLIDASIAFFREPATEFSNFGSVGNYILVMAAAVLGDPDVLRRSMAFMNTHIVNIYI